MDKISTNRAQAPRSITTCYGVPPA